MDGYFNVRKTEGARDALEVNTLALSMHGKNILIMSLDVCKVKQEYTDILRKCVSDVTSVPVSHIYVCATHTHTSPIVGMPLAAPQEM